MMKAGSRAPGIDQTCLRLTTPAAAFGTFYPRDATLARVFARATCPSVCPVRLSHAGVASKPARRYTSAIWNSAKWNSVKWNGTRFRCHWVIPEPASRYTPIRYFNYRNGIGIWQLFGSLAVANIGRSYCRSLVVQPGRCIVLRRQPQNSWMTRGVDLIGTRSTSEALALVAW